MLSFAISSLFQVFQVSGHPVSTFMSTVRVN